MRFAPLLSLFTRTAAERNQLRIERDAARDALTVSQMRLLATTCRLALANRQIESLLETAPSDIRELET